MIFFSEPSITKTEFSNVKRVLKSGVFTDGQFQKKTEGLRKKKINSNFIALTQSCTDSLELAGFLIDLKPGAEVIMPSCTFTSTANAVVLKGAKPVFVDINSDNLNIDSNELERENSLLKREIEKLKRDNSTNIDFDYHVTVENTIILNTQRIKNIIKSKSGYSQDDKVDFVLKRYKLKNGDSVDHKLLSKIIQEIL